MTVCKEAIPIRRWKGKRATEDTVLVGQLLYAKNKVPRVCKYCCHVFAGKLRANYCSDICQELHRAYAQRESTARYAAKRMQKLVESAEPLPVKAPQVVSKISVKPKSIASKDWQVTERNCIICGLPYLPKRIDSKTCSITCARSRKQIKPERTCLVCGNPFVPKDNESKMCSRVCGRISGARTRRKRHEMTCVICGNPFVPRRENQKACGSACARERQKRNTREKIAINCRACGIAFMPVSPKIVHCSSKCALVTRSKKWKEERHAKTKN